MSCKVNLFKRFMLIHTSDRSISFFRGAYAIESSMSTCLTDVPVSN